MRTAMMIAVGALVRMAEGQGITHKLTKRLDDMLPIEHLLTWATDLLSEDAD